MISNRTLNLLIKVCVWGIVVTGALLLTAAAHCRTTSGAKNSLGFVAYDSNPLMYVAGSLAQGPDAISNFNGNLNLRVTPLGTYMLYDESILFCGAPVEKFEGVDQPFLLTYERTAHKSIGGVGCHELVRVDTVRLKGTKLDNLQ